MSIFGRFRNGPPEARPHMIGIIGAMEVETEALRSLLRNATAETNGGTVYCRGELEGREVVIATCGIGKVHAGICTQHMIDRYHPDCILNSGVGGCLSPDLHIGDIAIATAAVQHDMDTSPLGDPVGMISGIGLVNLPCDPELVRAAQTAAEEEGFHTVSGVIATGDQFVSGQDMKSRITGRFGAIACDMEGGSIAQVCYLHGIPCLILRSISDEADGRAPENFPKFVHSATERSVALIRRLLRRFPDSILRGDQHA